MNLPFPRRSESVKMVSISLYNNDVGMSQIVFYLCMADMLLCITGLFTHYYFLQCTINRFFNHITR